MSHTTIQIDKDLLESLKKAKKHPRQTYNEVIKEMAEVYLATKKRSHYDEFLHNTQRPLMTELWDNEADEEWENA
jgi:predicted CopG family antitoxin